jgi:hydroxypyruvate isomerase
MNQPVFPAGELSRREALKAATVAVAGVSASVLPACAQVPQLAVEPDFKIRNRRIRQSIMGWTFNPLPTPELARLSRDIGLVAMEGIGREHYPLIRELGLEISLVGSHGFAKGPCDRAQHAAVIAALREGIDVAVKFGCQRVITFTGMRVPGLSDAAMADNCVTAWKEVIGYAEQQRVTLCL